MLKELRMKFVIINMILVTVMLLTIFGLIVHQTQENLKTQCIQMMQSIGTDSSQQDRPGPPPGNKQPNRPGDHPYDEPQDHSNKVRLPYFKVQIDPQGKILAVSGGFFDLSDELLLQEITQAALDRSDSVGELPEYKMRFCKFNLRNSNAIVFVDITSEQATVTDLIRTCILIGVVSFGVFLFISFRLAKWAVNPVDEAWQQQKQFVADASHELKTPVTVIMTNAELLQNPEYDDASRDRFAASILTMSHQMRGLVEGLLDLARVDNGAVRTALGPVSLSNLTEEACMIFEPLFFEKELLLDSRVEPGLEIRGSEAHLQQVLKILLDNAMKYSDPGTVTVTLEKQGNGCLLTVTNFGPAISPEDLKNIFKRFYRVDKSRHRDGSYGLGLSIAENIVREHNGRIWAESADDQNRFCVYLPIN